MVGCWTNFPTVTRGTWDCTWNFLRGGFSKGSYSLFNRVSEKTMENSKRLGRQVRPGIESGTFCQLAFRTKPFGHWCGVKLKGNVLTLFLTRRNSVFLYHASSLVISRLKEKQIVSLWIRKMWKYITFCLGWLIVGLCQIITRGTWEEEYPPWRSF